MIHRSAWLIKEYSLLVFLASPYPFVQPVLHADYQLPWPLLIAHEMLQYKQEIPVTRSVSRTSSIKGSDALNHRIQC